MEGKLDERQEDMLRVGTALRNIGWLRCGGTPGARLLRPSSQRPGARLPASSGVSPDPRLLPPPPPPFLRRSFWGQLVLTVVSTTILLFSTGMPSGGSVSVR